MRLNRKYVLLFSEALIPVLGFFLWGWGLYFILLFYFIDILAQEVIMHLKSKKIIGTQSDSSVSDWRKSGISSAFLILAMICLIHISMFYIDPSIAFVKQIKLFWTYEELGVQQGYLLLPLVGFAAFSQYRMDFLMPKKEESAVLLILWQKHLKALLTVIGFAGLTIGLSQVLVLPEVAYVLSIVGGIAVYGLMAKD
ncbi:MAG: hypothetical protein HRT57_04030 [Crocinitomicaceae bacterium]|nr:hypothetical protein [Crocinitomicaceae bacterium]